MKGKGWGKAGRRNTGLTDLLSPIPLVYKGLIHLSFNYPVASRIVPLLAGQGLEGGPGPEMLDRQLARRNRLEGPTGAYEPGRFAGKSWQAWGRLSGFGAHLEFVAAAVVFKRVFHSKFLFGHR